MATAAKSGFQPDYATHPGEILKETLEERGIPQSELGVRIGMSEKAVSQIINGIAPISFEMAMRLERVLDIPARFWNNLQSQWQEFRTAQAESRRKLSPDDLCLFRLAGFTFIENS